MTPDTTLDPFTLGQTLRAARNRCGYSQQYVADQCDFARTTVVAMEAGQRRITVQELTKLAAVYGVELGSLAADCHRSQLDARLNSLPEIHKRVLLRLVELRPDVLFFSPEQTQEVVASLLIHTLIALEEEAEAARSKA